MPETTPHKAPRKPNARSQITNGKLGDMDGRGKWARRLADLIALYTSDVTDDAATLPHAMQSLIRRAATLTVECERAEAAYAKDNGAKPADLEAYQRTTNTLYRLLGSLQVKAGLTEHLSRPLSRAPLTQGDSRFIRQVHSTFTVSDWRIAYGDDDAAVTRAFARSLLFSIEEAKHKGTPVPATLATFAIDNGIAEYADDQSPQTIDHEGRSAVSAIPIANDNTGCLQHADD